MWDNSKINFRKLLFLAEIIIAVSTARAAHEEETFLLLPSAEIEAAAKDYDHFFRVISWSNRDPSFAISIYFSHRTATLPERGFITLKARVPSVTPWERSRALTENEVETICKLIDHEEIFSLPAKQRSFELIPRYDPGNGPGYYFFVHVDKLQHVKEEVNRSPQSSNPAQRLVGGLGEIVKDYLDEFEKVLDALENPPKTEGKAKTE
jgi:hypothetical protein